MGSIMPLSEVQLADLYQDLHTNPELSFQETRTAQIGADLLRSWGFDVTTGVGGTGVVAILENGIGPTVLLRADMDALPVQEKTDLSYASTSRATDRFGNDVPVMHACGHDVHVTCVLGAASHLAADKSLFRGRLMLVLQPAEELGTGAKAMIADGLFERFGKPDVVLGQHVAPLPAGVIGLHAGLAMAASDSLTITMHGKGGHGSQPQATVDPIVMASATVMRLQTVVSRETAGTDTAVVTVGMIHAGTNNNIIPDSAELRLNVRTFDLQVRDHTLESISRIVNAEAQASGAAIPPTIDHTDYFPALTNDAASTERVRNALGQEFGAEHIVDIGTMTGSEDVGALALSAGVPCVFWFLGGAAPAQFANAHTPAQLLDVVRSIPGNHSPQYAPVIHPTLSLGVRALLSAVGAWNPSE